MANDVDTIEREISDVHQALGWQLSAAEEKARTAIDWRTHYRRNPVPLLAIAAAAGFLASAVIGGDEGPGAPGDYGDSERLSRQSPLRSSFNSAPVNSAFDHLMGAFVAAAAIKVSEYVEEWLPGFHQEYTRRQN